MDRLHLERVGLRQRCDLLAANVVAENYWNGAVSGPSLSILVVEDEWLLRQALCDELMAEGWSVREAASAERALAILSNGEAIDVLIADIRLDGAVTGWELARRGREMNAELAVIYVSANPVDEAQRVEGSVFLSKPCAMERLLASCHLLCDA